MQGNVWALNLVNTVSICLCDFDNLNKCTKNTLEVTLYTRELDYLAFLFEIFFIFIFVFMQCYLNCFGLFSLIFDACYWLYSRYQLILEYKMNIRCLREEKKYINFRNRYCYSRMFWFHTKMSSKNVFVNKILYFLLSWAIVRMGNKLSNQKQNVYIYTTSFSIVPLRACLSKIVNCNTHDSSKSFFNIYPLSSTVTMKCLWWKKEIVSIYHYEGSKEYSTFFVLKYSNRWHIRTLNFIFQKTRIILSGNLYNFYFATWLSFLYVFFHKFNRTKKKYE